MNTPPESEQKSLAIPKFISNFFKIVIVGILGKLVFDFLKDGYLFVTYSPPEPPHTSREIYKILRHQKSFYIEHNRFTKKYTDLSVDDARFSQIDFEVEMQNMGNRLFVYVHNKSKNKTKEKTSFGIITPIESNQSQQLTPYKKLHHEYFMSLVCSSDVRGTPLPRGLEITQFSERCPVGYTKYTVDRDVEYLPIFNMRSILNQQVKIYTLHQKFEEDIPTDSDIFIASKSDKYYYQIYSKAEQLIVIARPKTSEKASNLMTYLAIVQVNTNQGKSFIVRYCKSETAKIVIPSISLDTIKLYKGCPVGYRPQF